MFNAEIDAKENSAHYAERLHEEGAKRDEYECEWCGNLFPKSPGMQSWTPFEVREGFILQSLPDKMWVAQDGQGYLYDPCWACNRRERIPTDLREATAEEIAAYAVDKKTDTSPQVQVNLSKESLWTHCSKRYPA